MANTACRRFNGTYCRQAPTRELADFVSRWGDGLDGELRARWSRRASPLVSARTITKPTRAPFVSVPAPDPCRPSFLGAPGPRIPVCAHVNPQQPPPPFAFRCAPHTPVL